MGREFFELIGAFALWMLSGFKGRYEDILDEQANYSHAMVGLLFFIWLFGMVVLAFKLF